MLPRRIGPPRHARLGGIRAQSRTPYAICGLRQWCNLLLHNETTRIELVTDSPPTISSTFRTAGFFARWATPGARGFTGEYGVAHLRRTGGGGVERARLRRETVTKYRGRVISIEYRTLYFGRADRHHGHAPPRPGKGTKNPRSYRVTRPKGDNSQDGESPA